MSEQEIQKLLNTVQELTASVKDLTEENARLGKKLDYMLPRNQREAKLKS